ncbi:HAD-IB family hydrolase [Ferrimonas marina]|uniref:Phosphoserine phosphatase n=1 Tax=Ferrimonas marina TaxID=299255 RepID=A0A1M5RIS3_9GAMM|nr:HAD-IB family hydrolase [Ferrimonas marina]SHH25979.1 phosphoserine phosphatase [Ferrimonas marina]
MAATGQAVKSGPKSPPSPNLALFDFDGTLCRGDNFSRFYYRNVPRWRLWPGLLLCWPLLLFNKLGLLPNHRLRPLVAWLGFAGCRQHTLKRQGERFAQQQLPKHLCPEHMARLQWHRDRGDRILLVSASLNLYLRPWCQQQGIELLCSELSMRRGRCTGRYQHGDCSRERKRQRIEQHLDLSHYARIYAYGDTAEDLAMLGLADEAFYCGQPWSNPKGQ